MTNTNDHDLKSITVDKESCKNIFVLSKIWNCMYYKTFSIIFYKTNGCIKDYGGNIYLKLIHANENNKMCWKNINKLLIKSNLLSSKK